MTLVRYEDLAAQILATNPKAGSTRVVAIDQVLRPLASGRAPRYRRFDWDRTAYADWREVPLGPTLSSRA